MTDEEETKLYRKIIDELVHAVRAGQGHLHSRYSGFDLPTERDVFAPQELEAQRELVARLHERGDVVLSRVDREVLAGLIQRAFIPRSDSFTGTR